MEFAEQGGEGATPYEVLLHAALRGDSTRFTRQDGVEETWRVMQPLLDAPPPVHAYAPGSWGPGGGRSADGGARRMAQPVDRVMSDAMPQSAAAPSPFPPIADYAFLSNCHTGALIAPDGAIDWLCLPSFDSPSVFGTLLDRQAGYFRLGPFGINHPTSRAYEPGSNVLSTTWKTPSGWVAGPRRADDGPADVRGRGDAAHPAAGGRRRRPPPGANGPLPGGHRRDRPRLRAGLRLRPDVRGLDAGRREPACRRRDSRGTDHAAAAPTSRSGWRATGSGPGTCSRPARSASAPCRGPRDWRRRPTSTEAQRPDGRHDAVLARLAGTGADARPSLARPDPAVGAGHQGPHLHADRRHRGGAHDLAARDARRRAELGLPLHLDARHHLHVAGTALPEPGLGGRRVHAVRRRPRADRDGRAADHVRHRRPARPDGVHPRRPVGLRGCSTGADRQRGVRPAPERRVRRGPGLRPAAHATQPTPASTAVADRPVAGPVRQRGVARTRPGDLGGPRQAPALRVVQADGVGRAGPCVEAGRDPGRRGADGDVAGHRRRDQGRHPGERRRRSGRPAPALRDGRAGRLHAAGGALRLPSRRRTSGCAPACWRSPTS